jgi:capsular polysaccharide biosynthesis protein
VNSTVIIVALTLLGAITNGVLVVVAQSQHHTAETISYLTLTPENGSADASRAAVEKAAISVSEHTFLTAAESEAAAEEVAESLNTSATAGELIGRMTLVTDGTTPILTIRTTGGSFEGAAAEANAWTAVIAAHVPDTLGAKYTLVTLRSAAPGADQPLTLLGVLPGTIIGLVFGILIAVLIRKGRRRRA